MPRGVNRYDEAELQSRLWSPFSIRLALWLDASDLSTITVATGVSEWRDKSGNTGNATQATAGNQPSLVLNRLNTRSVLSFNGTTHFLSLPLASAMGEVYTAFFAFTTGPTIIDSTQRPLWAEEPSSGDNTKNYFAFNYFNGLFYDQFPPSGISIGTGVNTFTNVSAISTLRQTASNSRSLIVNGLLIGTANEQYSGLTITKVSIGSRTSTAGARYNGQIAEIIVVGSALSLADYQKVEGYLSWKWGIPLTTNHPYINRPPLIGD